MEEKNRQSSIITWYNEVNSIIKAILNDDNLLNKSIQANNVIIRALKSGHKIFACGCGGSSSDSSHFVAELLNRFTSRRESPLPAIDLSANISTITAIANDYDFKYVFSKQLEALGKEGDVLLAISTSGMSDCVLEAIFTAKSKLMNSVLLTGKDKIFNSTASYVFEINVPSKSTAHIQEIHSIIIHTICDSIDEDFKESHCEKF